jgi:hypothetical protein
VGYLKRKLSRARSSKAIEHARASHPEAAAALPKTAIGAGRGWFLRFVTDDRDTQTGKYAGVFEIAYRLCREPDTGSVTRDQLRAELDWFEKHLPVADPKNGAAVFFFKSDGGECTRRIWELARLLSEAGTAVTLKKVRHPGRIVYEDQYQVAAIPPGKLRRAVRLR